MRDHSDDLRPAHRPERLNPEPRAALRRQWPILLAAALICAGLGWGVAALRTSTYTSRVEVRLQPLAGAPLSNASRTSAQQKAAMNTELGSVDSPPVVRALSRSLSMPADAARSALHAQVAINTTDLVIEFTAATPERARRGASVAAHSLLQARADAARDRLDAHVARAAAHVAVATQQLAKDPKLRRRLIEYASTLEVFAPQLRDLSRSRIAPGTVTAGPSTPRPKDFPSSAQGVLVGSVAGLLLGTGGVLLRGRRRTRAHTHMPNDISGCPVLVVPRSVPGRPELAAANVYRALAASLLASAPCALAVVAVTSNGDAPREVVDELTRALSRAAARVACLDASDVELPSGPRLRERLRRLTEVNDVVLVAGTGEDGAALAVAAGQVLLTIREDVAPMSDRRNVIARLSRVGVTVRGLLVLPPLSDGV